MSGQPTARVYLDDGSGTYPTEITSRVRLVDGIHIDSYGRVTEFDQPQSAGLAFTVDNYDGAFTSLGTYSLSPTTGVRLKLTKGATTVNRFTGRIVSNDLGWPSGGQEFSKVTVKCQDLFSDLGRFPMRSLLEQEILLDGPTAYYTLGEPEGSTTAGDSSGHGEAALAVTGAGGPLTFGSGIGPVDGLSAAQFTSDAANVAQYLSADSVRGGFTTGGSWSLEMFAAGSSTPFTTVTVTLENSGNLSFISFSVPNGTATFGGPAGSGLVSAPTDNGTHHFVMTYDGSITRGYIDGVLASTSGAAGPTAPHTTFLVGAENGSSGTISHVAVYDGVVLSAARVASHAAVLTGFAEDTDDRLSRLASYAGLTATSTNPSGQAMSIQATSGQSLFDAMQTVANAEGGVLYVNGSGALVMQGRYYRGLRTTADISIDSDAIDPGTVVTWDTQQKINQVTVTRDGGTTQMVQTSGVAARTEFVYPASLDLAVASDADALGAAQWELNSHTTTAPRLASATFDLGTAIDSTNLSRDVGKDFLSIDIGARLALTPMPSQTWSGSTAYTFEGWSEDITDTAWTLTANLLPWSIFAFALYDDPGSTYDTAGDVYTY